jgi:hypothetical protein
MFKGGLWDLWDDWDFCDFWVHRVHIVHIVLVRAAHTRILRKPGAAKQPCATAPRAFHNGNYCRKPGRC